MRRPYPFDDQFKIDHPYADVADQLNNSSCVTSSQLQQYNRKRQRRQAAAVVVESLWNSNNNSTSTGNTTSPVSTNMNRIGTTTTTSAGRKSTAQPRPVLNVPPRGIGPITDPNENDVLCGRGGRINSHAGNVQFRDIIHSKKSEYLDPSTKKLEKAHIAAGIVSGIRTMDPAGRFLKEDKGTGMWFDIGDAKAIKKTGQALREDAPDIRPAVDGGTVLSGDEKNQGGSTNKKKPNKTTKSKSLSPPRSNTTQPRRGNIITGSQNTNTNLGPVWPQQGNIMQQMTDPRAQISMPPPFLPQSNSNVNVNMNNLNNFSMQQQPMHQQGFETRNIPMQVPSQTNIPSTTFPNQMYSGAQTVTNKVASASRKVMEALSQTGPTGHQQYNPYGYGRKGAGVGGMWKKEPNSNDFAFDRDFYDPAEQHIMNPGDDYTVSSISGLSEPNSSAMMGSGIGNSSNLMNSSFKSNFSVGNSLRLNNLKGSSTNNKQSYDPLAMSGLGLSGSIKSGFGGSLTRSNSFPDMNSVVEGDHWKSIMDADDNPLDDTALKYPGSSTGSSRIGFRNSSAMSIGSLMDVQSNASSNQWLAAAGLNYPPSMPDDKSFMDKSFMSSAMMSTDLDALDLASSERLNL